MANDNEFVEKRISSLEEPAGFKPNAMRARAQLHALTAHASRRWRWSLAAAAAAAIVMLVLPIGRAVASNPRPLGSVHEQLMSFHNYVYANFLWLTGEFRPGADAPNFALTDMNGKTVRLADYEGKVVLLNFWATWCAPCKAEIPGFMELQKTYGDDLEVLGVSFDEDGWNAVRPFVQQLGVNYPVMVAGPDLPEEYRRVASVPTTLLINRQGRVSRIRTDLATKEQYEEWIKRLL